MSDDNSRSQPWQSRNRHRVAVRMPRCLARRYVSDRPRTSPLLQRRRTLCRWPAQAMSGYDHTRGAARAHRQARSGPALSQFHSIAGTSAIAWIQTRDKNAAEGLLSHCRDLRAGRNAGSCPSPALCRLSRAQGPADALNDRQACPSASARQSARVEFSRQPCLCAVKFQLTDYFENNAVQSLGTGDP